jgi:hypothetical protein
MSAKGFARGQFFFGLAIVLLAVLSLLRARLALLHHTDVEMWIGRVGHTQMNPWQAMVAFSLCLVLGLVLLVNAIRKTTK